LVKEGRKEYFELEITVFMYTMHVSVRIVCCYLNVLIVF
jgi:hypothetical protein